MSRDIFGCPSWGEDATGIMWVEAGDAADHLQCTSHSSQGRSGLSCQLCKCEKPCSRPEALEDRDFVGPVQVCISFLSV